MPKSTRPRPGYSAELAASVKSYRDVPIPYLGARFEYRPNCGGIYRKDLLEYRTRNRPGERADQVNRSLGYCTVCITFCGKSFLVYAHRMAWALTHGSWPVDTIDHINMCRHDNRLANLRMVTNEHNQQNIIGAVSSRNKTGFRGVFRLKSGLFTARIYHGGTRYKGPCYGTASEANNWYRTMKTKIHAGYMGK